jgi:hypothetical protein
MPWLDIQVHDVVYVAGKVVSSFSRETDVIQISVPLKSAVMCQENMGRAG